MKIIILAGGYSPEREVSLSSGSLIANALMEQGHEVFFLDPWPGIREGEEVRYRTREDIIFPVKSVWRLLTWKSLEQGMG